MVLFPIDTMFLFELLFQLSRYAAKRMQPCDDSCIGEVQLASAIILDDNIETRLADKKRRKRISQRWNIYIYGYRHLRWPKRHLRLVCTPAYNAVLADDGMIARIYHHGRVANGKTKFRLLHFHHLHHYHNHA